MKLSSVVINKLISLCCSKTEINFIIYIAKFQLNDSGRIYNLYYKDIVKHLNCNPTTFYRILSKLECKGIITYEVCEKYGYYNFTILDNDFSNNDYSIGYVNVNKCVFSEDFFNAKATTKYVTLKLLLRNKDNGNEISLSDEYVGIYANINSKNKRLINEIINNIKTMKYKHTTVFEVFSHARRKGNVHFFKLKYTGVIEESETRYVQKNMFVLFCKKHNIEYNDKNIDDLIQMDNEYREFNKIYKNIVKEICLYYGKIITGAIRNKIKPIINRLSTKMFGNNKFEPIY